MRVLRAHRPRPAGAPFDVPCGDGYVGVRHDAGTLLTVLAVEPGPAGPQTLDRPWPPAAPGAGLSWATLSQWMSGPEAAAIALTVLTHGSAGRATGAAATAYATLVGPLSVAAYRSVHLAIRFTPLAHPHLVARYGEGTPAALRACLSATRRLAGRLADDGLSVHPLSAAGLTRLAEGMPRSARTVYAVDPADPAELPAALEAGWRTGDEAATAVHWRAGDGGPRVTALAYRTAPDTGYTPPGWRELAGHDGVAGSTALDPPPSMPDWTTTAAGTAPALCGTALPVSGAGVILGADDSGSPVALRLCGPGVPLVELPGDAALPQRLAVRLAALGVSAAVFTDRPDRWSPLIGAVADRRLLHPAADGAGQVLIDDRTGDRLGPLDGHTVWRVHPPTGNSPAPDPGTVRIRYDRGDPGHAVLSGAGREIRARLIATPAEDALLNQRSC